MVSARRSTYSCRVSKYLSNSCPHSGLPMAPYPGESTSRSFPGSAPTRKKSSARVRPYIVRMSLREREKKKKESATRTAFLLVGNNARRPKTALNKLDFPQFARPMTMTWRGPITNQHLEWEMLHTSGRPWRVGILSGDLAEAMSSAALGYLNTPLGTLS